MGTPLTIQGRNLSKADIRLIRQLLADHPEWSRYRLSRELAERWQWRNARGQLKDMACRTLLNKLHQRKEIQLPAKRVVSPNRHRLRRPPEVDHDSSALHASLCSLRPLRVLDLDEPEYARLFAHLLDRYHYLGYSQTIGENCRYLLAANNYRPVACLLFGAAAWTCAARDKFIGWDHERRQQRLQLLANNQRFLILPWVRTPHLASHVLGLIASRIAADWQRRYGHDLLMLETFVERQRFRGTCYRAANWQVVGSTTGRSRQDRSRRLSVPVKDVLVYPLHRRWRELLCE